MGPDEALGNTQAESDKQGAGQAPTAQALQSAMARVKELTPRGTHLTLETTIGQINLWYQDWSSHFAMTTTRPS